MGNPDCHFILVDFAQRLNGKSYRQAMLPALDGQIVTARLAMD